MPPPDDPFASPDPYGPGSADESPLESGAPSVASAPGKVFIILGFAVAVFTFMLFNIFVFTDDDEVDPLGEEPRIVQEEDAPEISELVTGIEPPPPLTIVPPQLPTAQPAPIIEQGGSGPSNELLRQRIRSPMVISGGGGGPGLLDSLTGETPVGDDPNSQFASSVYSSRSEKAVATSIGNRRRVVAEGRLIQAVLETAINTDLPGNIRAIVSRDVFPEAGNDPIIPKGSRLVGRYNSSILGGQKRVFVVWTRLIRPDGVDVQVNSPLVDQIGQAGVEGSVDTKFAQIFSRAALVSIVSIAVAAVVDEITGDEITTTTSGGDTTTNTTATSEATIESLERFGSIAERYLEQFINVEPTIIVDQGSVVNVLLQRDLIFPNQTAGTRFIE